MRGRGSPLQYIIVFRASAGDMVEGRFEGECDPGNLQYGSCRSFYKISDPFSHLAKISGLFDTYSRSHDMKIFSKPFLDIQIQ